MIIVFEVLPTLVPSRVFMHDHTRSFPAIHFSYKLTNMHNALLPYWLYFYFSACFSFLFVTQSNITNTLKWYSLLHLLLIHQHIIRHYLMESYIPINRFSGLFFNNSNTDSFASTVRPSSGVRSPSSLFLNFSGALYSWPLANVTSSISVFTAFTPYKMKWKRSVKLQNDIQCN